MSKRPIALITGASRPIGIGAAIAKRLAETGCVNAQLLFSNGGLR